MSAASASLIVDFEVDGTDGADGVQPAQVVIARWDVLLERVDGTQLYRWPYCYSLLQYEGGRRVLTEAAVQNSGDCLLFRETQGLARLTDAGQGEDSFTLGATELVVDDNIAHSMGAARWTKPSCDCSLDEGREQQS